MPTLSVTITPSAGVKNAIVRLDEDDITNLTSIAASSGPHKLHWWFAGNPGETLDIKIGPTSGGGTLHIPDVIADGFIVEAGDKTFTV